MSRHASSPEQYQANAKMKSVLYRNRFHSRSFVRCLPSLSIALCLLKSRPHFVSPFSITSSRSIAQRLVRDANGSVCPSRRQQNQKDSLNYDRESNDRFRNAWMLFGSTSEDGGDENFTEAQDLEALQGLFSKYCDKDGLMTKSSFGSIPAIAELLEDGDLELQEFDEIWSKASKFPDVNAVDERVDVDSFVEIYRNIDDLFEDDDDDAPIKLDTSVIIEDGDSSEAEDNGSEAELKKIFELICDSNGRISKQSMQAWEEVSQLQADGLLGKDEFDRLWDEAKKSPEAPYLLDVEGFLSFNVALDSLFEIEEDGNIDDSSEANELYNSLAGEDGLIGLIELKQWTELNEMLDEGDLLDSEFKELFAKAPKSKSDAEKLDEAGFNALKASIDDLFEDDDEDEESPDQTLSVAGQQLEEQVPDDADEETSMDADLSPVELFNSLKGADGLVGFSELKRWDELTEMLNEGDLLANELTELFAKALKSGDSNERLNREGFMALKAAVDDLFEDEDEEAPPVQSPVSSQQSLKEQLLDVIEAVTSDEELLPCGLDSSELDKKEVLTVVESLERGSNNIVRQKLGSFDESDLTGTWELLYSSSSAMRFNEGLSGLGGSVPNGKFGGLIQKLESNKVVADVEYTERIVVSPEVASFDVKVTGCWDLRQSVSLFTGEPSIVMTVLPDRVSYGPTSTRADHWKSLGPMNLLDVSYLDEDLRIMRGNTSVDTLFIFRRIR